jgi:exonuclease III
MGRPADRERARDETLARMGQLELQRKRYADVQLAPATRELLVETLRLGVRSDRATVSNTLRRVVTKIKMQKDRRTLYATVPCAVLSDHTPGATGTPAHSIEGRRSMH